MSPRIFSPLFMRILRWTALGLGLILSSTIILTGYWVYSAYDAVNLDRVASGQPLTNANWNTLVDVVNSLSTAVQKIRMRILSGSGGDPNLQCTTGSSWIICINPRTGKWYHTSNGSSQIYNDPYTGYPASLQNDSTVCKGFWGPSVVCVNSDNGDLAWISNGSNYWNYKKFSDSYPFSNGGNCMPTGNANAICNGTMGDWAYVDSSYAKWQYKDGTASYPSGMVGKPCVASWANIVCYDPNWGHFAYMSSSDSKWTYKDLGGYPLDVYWAGRAGSMQCNAGWPWMVCVDNGGILVWAYSNYSGWSMNNSASGWPFKHTDPITCKTGWANVTCTNLDTGVWAYMSSSDKTWTVRDFSASYPDDFHNIRAWQWPAGSYQCQSTSFPYFVCFDPTTGEWAFTNTTSTTGTWIGANYIGWAANLFY